MDATAADLLPRLLALRDELRAAPPSRESRVRPMPADAAASAANLNHYLAFRRHDARALQRDLARAGLSSLGRSESCVLASVEAVLANVERMAGAPPRRSRATRWGWTRPRSSSPPAPGASSAPPRPIGMCGSW